MSKRRLLLLALDWVRPKDPPISLGHASIQANLRKHNIDVISQSWSVNRVDFSTQSVTKFILNHASPDVDLAMGAYVWNESAIQSILKDINGKFPGKIILGGPQISYVKKGLEVYYPQADIFIRGYAEHAITDLMSHSDKKPIKGVHYARDPDLGQSAEVDLEALASPYLEKVIQPQSFLRWETQRGCPFKCNFCQYREPQIFKRRFFDPERVLKEAQWIAEHPVIQDVHVVDATFNSGPNYISVLKTLADYKFGGRLALQTRIEMITPEFLDAVQALNKTAMTVLEFGLQTIIPEEQKLINRPSNMRKIERLLREVKERQIESEISIIFGLPKQTLSSFQKSIEFCIMHGVPVIRAFPLMLLRGTPLYDQKESLGLVESNEIADEGIDRIQEGLPHVISSPSFTYSDWKAMAVISASLETKNQVYLTQRDATFSTRQSSSHLKNSGLFSAIKYDKEEHVVANLMSS